MFDSLTVNKWFTNRNCIKQICHSKKLFMQTKKARGKLMMLEFNFNAKRRSFLKSKTNKFYSRQPRFVRLMVLNPNLMRLVKPTNIC